MERYAQLALTMFQPFRDKTHLQVDGCYGSPPMSMANALSLFAPLADRDVANELDLLDMLDPEEQYEMVKSFAMKHIVPHMRG